MNKCEVFKFALAADCLDQGSAFLKKTGLPGSRSPVPQPGARPGAQIFKIEARSPARILEFAAGLAWPVSSPARCRSLV